MKKIFSEIKRPIACLMTLCLIITMVPMLPLTVERVERSYGAEYSTASPLQFSGDVCTITEDSVLDVTGGYEISDGRTIVIKSGKKLIIKGNSTDSAKLIIGGNVTIKGEGETSLLDLSGASIAIDAAMNKELVLKDLNITGRNIRTLIYVDVPHSSEGSISLENVLVSESVLEYSEVLDYIASFIMVSNGSTVKMKNTTVTGVSGGLGGIYLAVPGAQLQLEGSICISGAGSNSGINIGATTSNDAIKIIGALTEGSSIAVKNAGVGNARIECPTAYQASALDAFYVCDDFLNTGFTASGSNLVFTAKDTIATTYNDVGGTLAFYDTHGRSIVQGSTASPMTAKEINGREVKMTLEPASGYFIKKVTIGGVDKTGSIVNSGGTKYVTFAAATMTNEVVFEQAVTHVTLAGIAKPCDNLKVADSLSQKAIDTVKPGSATSNVTIDSINWKHVVNNTETTMSPTDKFIADHEYKLVMTLKVDGGSQFDEHGVMVAAAGESATSTIVSNTNTQLTVEIPYTAGRMRLEDAIALNYVTFQAIKASGNAIYDGGWHGPTIRMTDTNGGEFAISSCSAMVGTDPVGDDKFSVTTSEGIGAEAGSVVSLLNVKCSKDAGHYAAKITVENARYDGNITFDNLDYTITQRTITPTGIDGITSANNKSYDGTTNITATGLNVHFIGLVGSDSLTPLGVGYNAYFAFTAPGATNNGEAVIKASNISLITTNAVAKNYQLAAVTECTQAGATISKATPQPAADDKSVTFTFTPGLSLGAIGFGITTNALNWFFNPNAPDLKVTCGNLTFVDYNTASGDGTPTDLNTTITKNTYYWWKFVPQDTTNYTNRFGQIKLWPVAPIKSVTLNGITLPVVNTANAQGTVDVESVGPSAGSDLTIVSAVWKEYNPNTGTTKEALSTNDKFRYNRTYTLEVKMTSTDRFTTGTGVDALKVEFVSGTACEPMTTVKVDSEDPTKATVTFKYEIGKGTLDNSMFTLPTNFVDANAVDYKGTPYNCSIASIAEPISDGLLQCRVTTTGGTGAWVSYSAIDTIPTYRDVCTGQRITVEIKHPDYNYDPYSPVENDYYITISPRAITVTNIDEIEERPYNGTDVLKVTLSSVNLVVGDDIVLLASSGSMEARISDPNVNVNNANLTVTATDIMMSGESAGNYVLKDSAKTATTTGAFNNIQKVTPTGGSITWTAITDPNNKTYGYISPKGIGYYNEYITAPALNAVTGTISSWYEVTKSSLQLAHYLITKRHSYYWEFIPDSPNYNVVTGTTVFWEGAPITTATLTGIVLPEATMTPTALSKITLTLNDSTARVNVSEAAWYEIAPTDAAHEGVAVRELQPTDEFYYNRYHTLVVTLAALDDDAFNTDTSLGYDRFAGVVQIGSDVYECQTNIVPDTDDKVAVVTCDFKKTTSQTREITAMGTLTDDNLDARDFASYKIEDGSIYKNDLRGEGPLLTYVYTGRKVSPYPRTVTVQATEIQKIEYATSTDGSVFSPFTTEVPKFSEVMTSGTAQTIKIRLTHPDYGNTPVEKTVSLYIGPCYVRPAGVVYSGRAYNGMKNIDASAASILWKPTLEASATNEGITSERISALISYDAQYEFDGEDVGSAKTVNVSNIHFRSNNFLPQYSDN